jgi:hypothetical protein
LLATAQLLSAQLKLPDDVTMTGDGALSVGYNGSYGDNVQSTHGLQFGFAGDFSGYYYNPNFLSFNIIPYYNQSHANSTSASLTNSSGVNATANFFSGSHFPGSVNYSYTYNSSGQLGLPGVPAFTSVGTGQGFGIGWSALVPGLPTLSVTYSQGSGSSNLLATNQNSHSNSRTFGLQSSYLWKGFNLNANYLHQSLHSSYPEFLALQEAKSDTHGDTFGLGGSRSLPWNGQMFVNFSRNSYTTDYQAGVSNNDSSYTANTETAGANFHPTAKLTLSANESFSDNLSGYLQQSIGAPGVLPPPVNFGSTSNSFTAGGGAGYQITNYLFATAQATYYNQHYFGQTYSGTYLSGTLNYWRRLWNTFSFSAGVIDFASGQGNNANITGLSANGQYHNSLGFVGTVNASRWIKGWQVNGAFSYSQNVQSQLITYTLSNYTYNANIHRRFRNGLQWTAAFNGSRSGFTQQPDTAYHGESYSASLFYRWIGISGVYGSSSGLSLLTPNGIVPVPPVPGEINPNLVLFSGSSYGGSLSMTPVRRMTFSVTYNRAFSDTQSNATSSRNNFELINSQLQYRFRRIEFQAGYFRLTQGISASGLSLGTVTSYYAGISRWFNFF